MHSVYYWGPVSWSERNETTTFGATGHLEATNALMKAASKEVPRHLSQRSKAQSQGRLRSRTITSVCVACGDFLSWPWTPHFPVHRALQRGCPGHGAFLRAGTQPGSRERPRRAPAVTGARNNELQGQLQGSYQHSRAPCWCVIVPSIALEKLFQNFIYNSCFHWIITFMFQ